MTGCFENSKTTDMYVQYNLQTTTFGIANSTTLTNYVSTHLQTYNSFIAKHKNTFVVANSKTLTGVSTAVFECPI